MEISVVDYLIRELKKLGVKEFFGLPGDFNFKIIDAVQHTPETNWIGCTNELNAGYAADGYARIKGFGALITTYNVGELSALNAVAGSFAENVPVVHIVGIPSTKFIENNTLVHHNFQEPNYFASLAAFCNVTEASTMLNLKNAKKEIDRVLSVLLREKRPVYISIPTDICNLKIKDNPQIEMPESNKKNLITAVEHALKLITKANSPVIIGDVLTERFEAEKEFNDFVEKSGIPTTTFIMGKGLINETSPNFIGTYLAAYDNQNVYNKVNSSDCIISVGTIYNDFNTFNFDYSFKPGDFIEIQGNYTVIENKKYNNILMKDILEKLTQEMFSKPIAKSFNKPEARQLNNDHNKNLDFEYMSYQFENFFRKDDLIFTDTGILNYFMPSLKLPDNAKWYNQLLYSSIGWATPAAFGAGIAAPDKRIVLITGEGSHQLTVQSVSNMVYKGLTPKIFVLNNSGYTIERVLSNNPYNKYNEIIPWDYTKIFKAFKGDVFTAQVKTNNELNSVLNLVDTEHRLCYVELFTDKMDMPYLAKQIYNIK